jgi:hypothetical protein
LELIHDWNVGDKEYIQNVGGGRLGKYPLGKARRKLQGSIVKIKMYGPEVEDTGTGSDFLLTMLSLLFSGTTVFS